MEATDNKESQSEHWERVSLYRFEMFLTNFKYKPDWKFRIERNPYAHGLVFRLFTCPLPDVNSPEGQMRRISERYIIPPFSTIADDEHSILRFLYERIAEMEMHEMREWISVNGVRIYDPHTY